jgi:predicted house-cleaning noncanonical NTP pyrophosphatase (MazG superfamily)
MNKKKLNEVLDIEDSVQSVQQIVQPPEGNDDEQIDKDYEYTRTNLYNIIERGTEALEEVLEVAKQSQQPRAFEVVSTLVKTISDANKDLLELKNKQKALKGEKAKAKNVTNALFVGSTADLQKMIKDMKK